MALQKLIPIFIVITILCISFNSVFCQVDPTQYIKFYSDNNCTSLTGKINDTSTNLVNTTGLGNAQSTRVNGMWQIQEPLQNGDGSISTYLTLMVAQEACHSKEEPRRPYSIAERFGDATQDASEISFYTEEQLNGIRFKNDPNQTEVTLPRQIAILSWFFTGNYSWTIYPNTDFTGNSSCLTPDSSVVSSGFGFTYNWLSDIVVGSAKLGCGSGGSANGNSKLVAQNFALFVAFFVGICLKLAFN